jgi:hypothetical protein
VDCAICGAKLPSPEELKAVLSGRMKVEDTTTAQQDVAVGTPGIKSSEPELAIGISGVTVNEGSGTGHVKYTLAGDPIEVPPPPKPATATAGGPPPPSSVSGPPSRMPQNSGPQKTMSERDRVHAEMRELGVQNKGSLQAGILFVILVIIAGGVGFFFYQKSKGPEGTVAKALEGVKAKDWKPLFKSIAWPENMKPQIDAAGGEEKFAETAATNAAPMLSQIELQSFEITESTISGDTATVKVKQKVKVFGSEKDETASMNLKKVNGVWKLDATSLQGMAGGGGGGMGMGR